MSDTGNMQDIEFELSSGIRLTAHGYGNPGDKPVILSHGGGQTRHSWRGTAAALADRGWYALTYDHRGHGDSDWCDEGRYHADDFVEDQRELATRFDRPPVLVGASMGGIAAMLAEGESDESVFSAIVLVDIVPNMKKSGAEAVVAFMADRVEDGFASLEEAADAIARYTGRPRQTDLSGLRKNLRLHADGRYRWHWDPRLLEAFARGREWGIIERMSRAAVRLELPVLLIRGRESDLVTEDLAREFLRQVPHAQYVDVAHARHMVAGDRNDVFTDAVIEFLNDLGND